MSTEVLKYNTWFRKKNLEQKIESTVKTIYTFLLSMIANIFQTHITASTEADNEIKLSVRFWFGILRMLYVSKCFFPPLATLWIEMGGKEKNLSFCYGFVERCKIRQNLASSPPPPFELMGIQRSWEEEVFCFTLHGVSKKWSELPLPSRLWRYCGEGPPETTFSI